MSLEINARNNNGSIAFSIDLFYPQSKLEIYHIAIVLNKAILDNIFAHLNSDHHIEYLAELHAIIHILNDEQNALKQILNYSLNEELAHFYNTGGLTADKPEQIIDNKIKAAINDGIITFCSHLLEVNSDLDRKPTMTPVDMYLKLRNECEFFFSNIKKEVSDSEIRDALDELIAIMKNNNKYIKMAVYH